MKNYNNRLKTYANVSTNLASTSTQKLELILADAKPMHQGIGGKSVLISVDESLVFVKKIPLTELEQLPQHLMSTANFFNLPPGYQYGTGSAGFGAWRELATHIMTTNWVIAGESAHFPLLYHYRILPCRPCDLNTDYWGDIDAYCQYWENSNSICKRVEALNQASAQIVLFLEYIPKNLYDWLGAQLTKGGLAAEKAVAWVDKDLKIINKHMNEQGLVHFDAHFNNILTDGQRLYLSDFGLALSATFDLSNAETEFLKHHQSFDQACHAVNLLHCIITSLFGKEAWIEQLQAYLAGKGEVLPPVITAVIKDYAPIALLMDDFFQKLQKESKSTPYPALALEKLLALSPLAAFND